MGMLVDQPKPGGSGNTNDGNMASRFFKDPSLSASITGVNENLIHRFGNILVTISCGYAIDSNAFAKYALKTARLFVDTYLWYYMPVSVHKILLHGATVIAASLLPVGQLSKEAQEARNKDYRYFREHHTRKITRQATNADLLNRLLMPSDPVISSLRKLPKKDGKNLREKVVALLQEPKFPAETEATTSTADVEQDFSSSSDEDFF